MRRSGNFLRLVGAELARLRSRRLTLAAALLVLAAVGLFQLAVDAEVSPPSAADVTEQRQYYEQAHTEWEQTHVAQEKDCQDSGGSQEDCVWPEPTPEDYSLTATTFADVAPAAVQLSAYVTLLASFLVGASFIGAEYSTGSLANWLTFVPQRLKVYGSKLVAVVLGSAVGGAVANFLMLGLVALLTRAHGGGLDRARGRRGHRRPGRPRRRPRGGGGLRLRPAHPAHRGRARHRAGLPRGVGGARHASPSNADGPLGWLPPWLPENNLAAFLEHGTTYQQYVETVTAAGHQRGLDREAHLVRPQRRLLARPAGGRGRLRRPRLPAP